MYIDKKSPIPAYYQLKKIILKKIENSEFCDEKPIPSERDLSDMFNISRMTVRQALNQLVNEGVLYREKGKGTFVSKGKIEERNIMSFSDIVRKKGLVPSTRVLNFSKAIPEQYIKELLDLKDSEKVYNIKRLRLANDVPIGIEEAFIPERLCPNLERHDLTDSLHKLIKEEYLYTISFVDNIIEAAKPSKEEKELLNINNNIPVIKITGVCFIAQETRFIYEKSTYRSDEYKYGARIYVNKDLD